MGGSWFSGGRSRGCDTSKSLRLSLREQRLHAGLDVQEQVEGRAFLRERLKGAQQLCEGEGSAGVAGVLVVQLRTLLFPLVPTGSHWFHWFFTPSANNRLAWSARRGLSFAEGFRGSGGLAT